MGSSAGAPQASPSTSTQPASSSFFPSGCPQGTGICTPVDPSDFFVPPPPIPFPDDSSDDGSRVSPLMIALITVLAAAFLLLSYYTFASRCCNRRRTRRWSQAANSGADADDEIRLQTRLDLFAAPAAVNSDGGLDERFIRAITVFKYSKGDGLVESTDCAVCLTEFQETESLRLMPNCQHAFHPPCIDEWLRSHSNCPICRSSMIGAPPPPPPPLPPRRQSPAPAVVSRMRVQRGGDVVVMVDGAVLDRVREIGLDSRRQVSPAAEVEVQAVGEKERRGN